jgi:hypothetical protein
VSASDRERPVFAGVNDANSTAILGVSYALREARYRALRPLPAPMPHASATTALKTLGFPATPFHDPSLVAWLCRGPPHRARCGIPLLHRPSALGDGLHSS